MTDTQPDHADILDLPLDEVKRIALEKGYHVTAVTGGYKVQRQDEIGGPDEGTDYDLSYVVETEEQAYKAIRDELWQQADIRSWIAGRRKKRLN